MKKSLLVMLSLLIFASTISIAQAKSTTNSSLASAIRLYKAGNYSQSYLTLQKIVEKDPSNAVAYYYLAMSSAQIGKKGEAIENYERVLSLSPNNKLGDYATKGKTCLEAPDKCHSEGSDASITDKFIRGTFGSGFSKEARSDYEKHKIENLMREMNRNTHEIAPQKFKEYKDFSSQAPTNDEIVYAMRVLQRAGFGDIIGNGGYNSDLSLITGNQGYYNQNNNYEMLNLLLGRENANSNLSPQVIQSLLTSQMSTGF